ncbi:MAG: S8 family serine peptidase [Acidobacteria bacterium]|nr:S8 family serine peptidase [Acidobacteriota bacterium]
MIRRPLAAALTLALLLPPGLEASQAPRRAESPLTALQAAKISPFVLNATAEGAEADFLVVLGEQADLSGASLLPTKEAKGRFVRDRLWEVAQRTQKPLRDALAKDATEVQSFYIVNMLRVKGARPVVESLARRTDVARIEANPRIHNKPVIPTPETRDALAPAAQTNINYVMAPDVWALGFTGQNVVVAGSDTGIRWDHEALKPHYRGWDGMTANHDYNWHDSVHTGGSSCGANTTAPCDDNGHGTHTVGTAVGQVSAGNNEIGVAPGAKWIGCRNMNAGVGTPATYTECMEFFLAPYPVGGTPAQGDPAKAPHVTINSWGCPADEGCSANTLLTAVNAQKAAGIFMVVAAGNEGSGCSTVGDPPSFYESAFSVGALNTGADTVAGFSSRGPVTADGSGRIKPDIMAPGTSIRSCTPGSTSSYSSAFSGTSMATPHVSGVAALLLSAKPVLEGLTDQIAKILTDTSVHIASSACSSSGFPNNTFGWGRINALAAVNLASTRPIVASVSPPTGPATGGTTLTITGENFSPSLSPTLRTALAPTVASTVTIGGVAANVVSATATQIVVTTPPHAAGFADVTVTNPGGTPDSGTLVGGFQFSPCGAPTTASSNGPLCTGDTLNLSTPVVGGATYTWTGPNGFSSTSRTPSIPNVTTANAGTYSVSVATSMSCVAPPATTDVAISAPAAQPSITGATSVCTNAALTLNATAGYTSYQWYRGGNPIGGATSATYTKIATAGDSGSYTVTGALGTCPPSTASSPVVVTVAPCAAPTASSVTPPCASTVGGRSITITGSGYQPGATVTLAGVPATVTNVAPGSITVTAGSRAVGPATQGDVKVINPDNQTATLVDGFSYALRGDANNNGSITGADAFFLNLHVFLGGTAPATLCNGDANGNGAITGADAFFLNLFVFLGGTPPGP